MSEYIHTQKNLSTSPRKLRLVADMVRKMTPQQALQTLKFTRQSAALDLSKVIKTALANTGKSFDEGLAFKKIEVNEGFKLKRFRSAARGRSRRYTKRTSQVKVVLSDEVTPQNLTVKSTNQKPKVLQEKGEVKSRGT